jgi:hypothetical protein
VLNDVKKLLETKCQGRTSWGREKKIRKKNWARTSCTAGKDRPTPVPRCSRPRSASAFFLSFFVLSLFLLYFFIFDSLPNSRQGGDDWEDDARWGPGHDAARGKKETTEGIGVGFGTMKKSGVVSRRG